MKIGVLSKFADRGAVWSSFDVICSMEIHVCALQSAKFPIVLVLVAQIYLLFNDILWHVSPQCYLTSVPSFSFFSSFFVPWMPHCSGPSCRRENTVQVWI